MAHNGTKKSNFEWTETRELAAALLAQDEKSDEVIAEELGIGRRTLARWKDNPAFAARVTETVDRARATIRRRGISIVENRIQALQDRWERLKKIMVERAASPEMQDVPGGETGLLVHDVKSIGAGKDTERIDLYEVDTGLLKELREHEKQAAQELGQWQEKIDHTSGGQPFPVVKIVNGVSMNDL